MIVAYASRVQKSTNLSRFRHELRGSTALCALMLALSFAGEAKADSSWTGGAGNWSDVGKWSAGLPSGTLGIIGQGAAGQVTIDNAQSASNIRVGGGSDLHIVTGGILTTIPAVNAINTIGMVGLGDATMRIDAGAVWNAGQSGVRVGDGANGVLSVASGGSLNMTNGTLSVGLVRAGTGASTGHGTLNIDGVGTVINNNGALRLGYNGATGELNITNGGKLSTSGVFENHIGQSDTLGAGKGIATISGAGSSWTLGVGGTLAIGRGAGAEGTLNIADGGQLKFEGLSNVQIGFLGGTGDVTVTGANSVFESAGGINIGAQAGSTGTFTVSNGGELKTGANGVGVGMDGGNGTLNVDGGKVTSQGGLLIAAGSAPGSSAGSQGKMFVSNGSTVTASGFIVADKDATGELHVASGSKVTLGGDATIGTEGEGVVTVDGNGTELTTDSRFVVGRGAGGDGKLSISNGAVVTANGTNGGVFDNTLVGDVGGKGELDVSSGGKFDGGYLYVGSNAGSEGALNVESAGQVKLRGDLQLGWIGGEGTATITGQGTKLDAAGNVVVGHDANFSGTTSTGVLTVADGAVLKANSIVIGYGTGGDGTLNIGTGGAAGVIDPATTYIAMSGASSIINFNHNEANYAFNTAIKDVSGFAPVIGSVNFIGTGTTTLTAVNEYTAATNVNAGKLVIAEGASIASSGMTTVNDGATLAGAGTVGNVDVKSGATIAPTALKTLTVKGITFADGSTYQVAVNGAGASSKIAADTASLNGTVQVIAGTGNFAPGMTYTILTTTAANGVTGTFDNSVFSDFAFLNAALDYDPNKVDLKLTRNSASFGSVGLTPNQSAVGRGLDSADVTSPVYAAVVQQNAAGARQAFDALSGEAHASNKAALVSNALLVGDTIGRRASEPRDKATASVRAWAQGFGNWMDASSDGNAAKLDSTTGGVISGLDATANSWRFGVAAGYSKTDANVSTRASSLQTDSYHVSVYGGTRQGPYNLLLGGVYSWNDISADRTVAFQGFSEALRASYSADTVQVFGEANVRFPVGGAIIEPFAGFSYINHETDAFSETGGAAALRVARDDLDITFTTVGLRPSIALGQGLGLAVTARGTLAWRHAFSETDTALSASLAGSSLFQVDGVPISEDALLLEAGVDVDVAPNALVGLSWSGQYGDDATNNQLKGQFLYRW